MKRCYAGEDKRRGSGGQRPENGVWCVLCSPSSNPLSRYSALRHPSSCERAEGLQVMRPSLYHGQQPFSRCISGNASAAMHQRQCISGNASAASPARHSSSLCWKGGDTAAPTGTRCFQVPVCICTLDKRQRWRNACIDTAWRAVIHRPVYSQHSARTSPPGV